MPQGYPCGQRTEQQGYAEGDLTSNEHSSRRSKTTTTVIFTRGYSLEPTRPPEYFAILWYLLPRSREEDVSGLSLVRKWKLDKLSAGESDCVSQALCKSMVSQRNGGI